MLVARRASCRVANTFSNRLKLIWPTSSLETTKMSKKRIFGQKAPGVNGFKTERVLREWISFKQKSLFKRTFHHQYLNIFYHSFFDLIFYRSFLSLNVKKKTVSFSQTFFQVSFILKHSYCLKVILYVTKITSNTMTMFL